MANLEERTAPTRVGMFSLLRARRFAPLFVTQFLGALNDNVFKSALGIFITFSVIDSIRNHSAELVTVAAGLFILPFFCSQPLPDNWPISSRNLR